MATESRQDSKTSTMYKQILTFLILFLRYILSEFPDDPYEDDDTSDDNNSDYEGQKCNPYRDKACLVNDEALGKKIFESFAEGTKYFTITSSTRGVRFGSEGLALTIQDEFDNPALVSSFYIMYGKVEAEIKGAAGKGIISSFYLQSDDLDEIDVVEIFGSDPYEFQTNIFIKGNTTTYDRGRYHEMHPSPLSEFHKYGIEWSPDLITWYLDDKPVRMLGRRNKHGLPCSPMFLKFSLWSVEDDDEGTIAWAGGAASFSEGPFTMHIKNLKVQDYSKALTYSYGNLRDGNWLDLRADGGYLYEGHKYCLPPKMLDKLKPTPKQETDDDQVFTSSKLQRVATKISKDKNTVSYYPPSATNSHTTWDRLLEWETEQDETGTDDTENSDNEEEEESITAIPISKLRKGSTRRLDISTQLPPLSQNESKIAEIKNITTTKHIHNTTTSLQISKIESKKVGVTTTIYSSSTPQSTSKSRMPYNIFFNYPGKENSRFKSGVSSILATSFSSVVIAEILVIVVLLL